MIAIGMLDASLQSDNANADRLSRTLQTTRARNVALQSKARKVAESSISALDIPSRASVLQSSYFTSNLHHPGGHWGEQDYQKKASERARCNFSLINQVTSNIRSLFQDASGTAKPVQHIVNSVIADDTDTRMRSAGMRSTIHTVCNTVSALHVRYHDPSEAEQWESLNIPTPMLVLAAPKTGDIHAAATACSVVCGHQVGKLMQDFGLAPAAVASGREAFRTSIMVGDALKANAAAWKCERALLARRRLEHNEDRTLGNASQVFGPPVEFD